MGLKTLILTLIFSFSFLEIHAQKSEELDSLTNLLPTLSDSEEKVKVLSRLMILNIKSDKKMAFSYGYEGISLGKKIDFKMGIATLYKDVGVIHAMSSQLDSSRYYYELALNQFGELLDLDTQDEEQKQLAAKGYTGALGNLGNWFYFQSDLDSCIYYHRKTLELCDQYDLPNVKANSLNVLGVILIKQGKYDLALDNNLEALTNYQKLENLDGISRIYMEIGNINLSYKKDFQTAADYFRKAAAIKKEIDNELGVGVAYSGLANAFLFMGQVDSSAHYIDISIELAKKHGDKRLLIDDYLVKHALDEKLGEATKNGIANSLKMIQLSKEINYTYGEYSGYGKLGISHKRAGNHKMAVSAFEKGIEMTKSVNDIQKMEIYYGNLYEIYKSKLNNPQKALYALEKQFFYKDSLRSIDRTRQVEQLSVQFETEQKEKEIAVLEKDKALTAVEIQQGKNRILTFGIGALGLLLLSGFLYYRFRYVRKVNEELDRLNTTKDRLFAIVSHDLRGAVSAFQNIGQIINFHLRKGNYERLGAVALQVDKSANNLNNLLDNLLQWSVSQLDGVDINPTKLNVRKSVGDIVELFEQNASVKGTELKSFIKDDLQAIVDENSLHLILRNLVSNAIKFTSEGDQIEIHGSETDNFVELTVKDTGIGIPSEKMARIFQIDSKTSSKGTSGERGTGLGLALCKEFVERNGGSIELNSTFGEGTVCLFRLPKAV